MRNRVLLSLIGLLACSPAVLAQTAPAADPFATSQQAELRAAPAGAGSLTVRGFVDAGYINITQTKPTGSGGDMSWAYGNSQFTFASAANTFTVNQVNLALRAEREHNGLLVGGVGSISFYPSRDAEIYGGNSGDREFQADQANVFVEFRGWKTRIQGGRSPGFLTLEQQEAPAPEFRMIGHTYVYQAGGGYPYGVQVHTTPFSGFTVKLEASNGGIGDYTFFPSDRSTANLPVANDKDQEGKASDKPDGQTAALALDWVVFDRAASIGALRLGGGGASNPALTYNPVKDKVEPYAFSNLYLAYRLGAWELRAENAGLRAYYASSLGLFEAAMYYALVSYEIGANHLVTLRGEGITFVSDLDAKKQGKAVKSGLSYRYRIAPPMVLKLEYVTETQSPQFYQIAQRKDLTTNVTAASWVYSF